MTLPLLPHQQKAFVFLKEKPFGGIFFEQGLGKTSLAIKLLDYWLSNGIIEGAVVITRRSLITNWRSEFARFSQRKVVCPQIKGDSLRYSIFASRNVFLMHYEGFGKETFRLKEFFEVYKIGLVLDEAHYIKNPDTKNSSDVLSISDLATKRLVLTGTPIPNRPYDLWNLCRFLDPDFTRSLTFQKVKRDANLPSSRLGLDSKISTLQRSVHFLKRKIVSHSVFAFKDSLPIPKKSIKYELVLLNKPLANLYKSLKKKIGHLEVDSNKKNEECLLKKYLRLIQFCSCPKILFPHLQGPFPKDFYVFKEIENANKLKEPIIIWTAFNETSFYLQSILKKHYPNLKVFLVNGRTPLQKRNFEISNFKRSPFSVLIATIGTCKEGLNLQNASRAVFVDSSYKLDDFLQAQDRIHRLFQKKKCKVFQLLYNNSIEIWINRLLKAKEHLAKDVFNNESNIDHNVFNSLFDEKETLNEIKIISSFY